MTEPSNDKRGPDSKEHEDRLTAARWSSIGLQIGISVAIGALGGLWLDDKFDTEPIFVLTGIFLGLTAVFIDIYRLMKETQDDS